MSMFIILPNGSVIDFTYLASMLVRDEVLSCDSPDGEEHPPTLFLFFDICGTVVIQQIERKTLDEVCKIRDAIIQHLDLPVCTLEKFKE